MAQRIDEVLEGFKARGIQLERRSTSFSMGSVEECKALLKEVMLAVDKTITEKSLVWLPQYDQIADWMADTKGKGLFLRGGCGTGKSTIIYSVIPVLFNIKCGKVVIPMRAVELNQTDKSNVLDRWSYCIDDLGTEGVKNEYGNRYNVFEEVCDKAEQELKPMFISTNLTGVEVVERYGQRILDRIVRLCRIVKFTEKKEIVVRDAEGREKRVIKDMDLPSLRR